MRISRRAFLEAMGAVGLAASFSRFGEGNAWAQTADGYRALVCVFLFGGNDGNNMVVPLDSAGYAAYASARGVIGSGGLALPQNELLPLTPPGGGTAAYGFHPNLPELQTLWSQGALGVVFNVGTLLAPTTKATYLANAVPVPISLLSHQDQQHQWQTSLSDQYSRTGWGGRIADGLAAAPLPAVVSISGNQLYCVGAQTSALALPAAGGGFGLAGYDGTPAANARLSALDDIRMLQEQNLIVQATQAEATLARSASTLVAPVLAGTGATTDALFAGLTSSIALQLKQVARMIAARQTLGVGSEIFFVSQSSYDTHNTQLERQGSLFADLSPALKAFYGATVQLGVSQQVTSFTLSDFGRTLQPASGDGSDHAWGNHQLVIGGAVRGGQTYGTFPSLELGGPDDFTTQGRWVPTIAVDQYAATLATWFGVSASDLTTVLPYVGRYATANLGFLG
jgi:uncharacterized protein (DUF1501 family)